jgi:heme a synthase
VIGLAFLLPLLWFALSGRVDRALGLKLGAIFVLGGLQGALGWYMVKSGLVDDPRVSQYRLTAHLGLAFLIYAAMLWVALDLLAPGPRTPAAGVPPRLRRAATGLLALVFVMVLSGGLVAGIRAGFAYNTFPLMNGHVVATVQFDHRLLAWTLAVLVPWFWFASRRAELPPRALAAATLLLAALAGQIALGIATLLLVVPLSLAALHQAGAVVVFTAAIWLRHNLR